MTKEPGSKATDNAPAKKAPDRGDRSRQGASQKDEMTRAVEQRVKRMKHWEDFGERSIGQNLSMIGSLGWLVILPTLVGLGLGRYLDQSFETGIFWSAAFIFLGVAFGSYLAWRHIGEE